MTVRILHGDCRAVLPTLAAGSVQMVCTSPPYFGLRSYLAAGHADKAMEIGCEQSPDLYVAALVAVFREVRRVLADTGVVFLNLGDSYAGGGPGNNTGLALAAERCDGVKRKHSGPRGRAQPRALGGAKPKDLLMIPARVALALQADGWWLRSAITWCKPAAMPESVRDRPTGATEMVYLLTKRATYFYDSDAIAEPVAEASVTRLAQDIEQQAGSTRANGGAKTNGAMKAVGGSTRNARNWWVINPGGFVGAHFATMPPELAERCIKAGTSERGCCPQCLAPWVRVTERGEPHRIGGATGCLKDDKASGPMDRGGNGQWDKGHLVTVRGSHTTGWEPTCECLSLRCVSCAFVLDQTDGDQEVSTREVVSNMRDDVPPLEATEQLLQPGLLSAETVKHSPAGMSSMPTNIPPNQEPGAFLQPRLFSEMDGDKPLNVEGVDDNIQGLQTASTSRSSERDELRLCHGTSPSDGEEARPASDKRRGGPPQKRRQAGQSTEQPGIDAEAASRRRPKAPIRRNVSALQSDFPGEGQCPHCGSRMEWSTPNAVPCTVLDCFSGAGTTALVADRLGRHAVGIELNPVYAAMGRSRVIDDAPLLAEVAD